jgi:hypothetical protein
MIVLVISSVLVVGLYAFLKKQRRTSTTQRLVANTESLAQIAFFIIGRDIRRGGSNPAGALNGNPATPIAFGNAGNDTIQIFADLDGDGTIEANTDENITYQWIDGNADGVKDQIRRQSGNQLVIDNIRQFDLSYKLVGTSVFVPSTNEPEKIRVVRLHLIAGTGQVNPDKGTENTKEIQMDFLLRNFR